MKEETKEHLFTIIGSIIIGLIVVLITICLGCAEKHEPAEVEYTEIYDYNDMVVHCFVGEGSADDYYKKMIRYSDGRVLWEYGPQSQGESNRTLYSNVYKNVLERLYELEKPTEPYDPNAPQYAFLEVAEPNWVAAYGDTLETRMVYNISKNRVMNAMLGKRLLALENPVETEQSAEEAITPCEEPKKEVVDQNEVKQ